MKKLSLIMMAALLGTSSFAGAVTQAQAQARTSANMARLQAHTSHNMARYQKAAAAHMSQYQRAQCHKERGVVVKTKSGSLVCTLKKK